ncbi:NAD(P)H-dependent oxidoreductase [Actinomadura viridis]|uniref:NAD(P)H-dependent FMN reductase n=1 Tax=Actinomadura viridis TaxID=58110 RepID=A0A931GS60_9ACTN|nr:NAD(P)H-dependent oxidoreductase [Actinomadura viridis]MBG6093606.1 NAD(P)H-dependent FMN reductase [Actinomadura viridis]
MSRAVNARAGEPGGPEPVRLAVIIGSTREGRAGEAVAHWFAARARRRDDLAVDVVDLADFTFPHRYPCAVTPHVAAFTGRIELADAFAVVTPEYNHSFPASLKQAIDYAYDEWRAKPVGFVAYGHRSQGFHAIEHLRTVFTELHMVTVRGRVTFDLLECGDGVPPPDDGAAARDAGAMLDQLTWWALALREARAVRPYVS